MKRLLAVTFVALLGLGLAPLAARAQQKPSVIPLNPPPANPADNPLQTVGHVGQTTYRWTNGRGWQTLEDPAKVAMVAGIEQGLILAVRENWDVVTPKDQPVLVKTATRLTVGGVSFNQMVTAIDEVYMDVKNVRIPVVDAYMYALMKMKNTPKDELEGYLELLRKTYPPPAPPKKTKE
jgi:hypothetical protein